MLKGGEAVEIGNVGGEGPGGGGPGLGKECAGIENLIEERGGRAVVAEHVEDVVAKAINDKEEDIWGFFDEMSPYRALPH